MGSTLGYTAGVFDMFHIGHLNILRNCRLHCDRLVVGVTTDELAMQRKGKRPIIAWDERIEIVRSIRFVDDVVAQTTMDKMVAWEALRFDVMLVGDDWKGSPSWQSLETQLEAKAARVVYLPYTQQTSSTYLRERLEAM